LAFAAVRGVGAVWAHERAIRIFKQIMAGFEPPAMHGDHREELTGYRRKQKGLAERGLFVGPVWALWIFVNR
jgi:hypothetical protein